MGEFLDFTNNSKVVVYVQGKEYEIPQEMWQAFNRIQEIEAENKQLKEALSQPTDGEVQSFIKDVAYIMEFHAGRCPLDPENNYSGSEEHLAMYRRVMKQATALQQLKPEQAVTDEAVRDAIAYYSYVAMITEGEESLAETSAFLAIKALQAYRPVKSQINQELLDLLEDE